MKPLRIGMGGFARVHHDTIAQLEKAGEFRLVGTCNPRMEAWPTLDGLTGPDVFKKMADWYGFLHRERHGASGP